MFYSVLHAAFLENSALKLIIYKIGFEIFSVTSSFMIFRPFSHIIGLTDTDKWWQ